MANTNTTYTGRLFGGGNGYPNTGMTWIGASTTPYEMDYEMVYNRRIQLSHIQEAKEELDNLLEDYMEELRASEETTIDIADVINKLQGMQKSVEEKISGSGPDVDSDFEGRTPEFEELRQRARAIGQW